MSEKDKLLHQISVLDFTLVDLLLYLDTHPYDQTAQEYYCHYNQIKKKLCIEFAQKYYPLTKDEATYSKEGFTWVNAPAPWEYCGC